MFYTFTPQKHIPHCYLLTNPIHLLHSSHHHHLNLHHPSTTRTRPSRPSTGIFYSLPATNEQNKQNHQDESSSGIFTNMWWADLKAAVGQRINVEGILFSVSVITRNKQWVIPHVSVPDVRYIDWAALKRMGFEGVVFDKDNTLTVPYSLSLWGPLTASVESCKSVFGDNVAVFSNSAGNLILNS